MSYNIFTGKEFLDCHLITNNTILTKRKYNDAFGSDTFDDSRYGQHIGNTFFKENIKTDTETKNNIDKKIDEKEILEWCSRYLENKRNNKK